MTKASQITVKKQSTHKRNTSGLIPFKPGPDARRNMKGPNIKAFRDLSKLALEKGNELAYTPAGKPIIWNGKHLTFAEFVIMSWLSDKKFMHEWRDIAVGKVPQPVELGGEVKVESKEIDDKRFDRAISSLSETLRDIISKEDR